jgi:hypothetical protein
MTAAAIATMATAKHAAGVKVVYAELSEATHSDAVAMSAAYTIAAARDR